VKQHKWFSKVNWGLLRNSRPPVSFFCFFFVFSSCGADVADYTRDAIEWRRERELATYQGIELSSLRRAERIGEQWQSGRSWDGGSVWGILECDAALRRRYLMGRSPFSYAQVLNDIGNGLKYFID